MIRTWMDSYWNPDIIDSNNYNKETCFHVNDTAPLLAYSYFTYNTIALFLSSSLQTLLWTIRLILCFWTATRMHYCYLWQLTQGLSRHCWRHHSYNLITNSSSKLTAIHENQNRKLSRTKGTYHIRRVGSERSLIHAGFLFGHNSTLKMEAKRRLKFTGLQGIYPSRYNS